jgi:hypothetical protein
MKKKKFLWLLVIASFMVFSNASLTGCKKDDPAPTPGGDSIPEIPVVPVEPGKYEKDVATDLDYFKTGSGLYIITMDKNSVEELADVTIVPPMIRTIDVFNSGESLIGGERSGKGAFGTDWGSKSSTGDDPWIAFDVRAWSAGGAEQFWNGGAIVADTTEFPEGLPNLKVITDNADDYYFHFAVRSPADKPKAGLVLILYSDGTPTNEEGTGGVKLFVGPTGTSSLPTGVIKMENYQHDNEWHHFEIPVSELTAKGYKWNGPIHGWTGLPNRAYLLTFQSVPHVEGTEINLDAAFFYKKPASQE